jgi:hypothetical protein
MKPLKMAELRAKRIALRDSWPGSWWFEPGETSVSKFRGSVGSARLTRRAGYELSSFLCDLLRAEGFSFEDMNAHRFASPTSTLMDCQHLPLIESVDTDLTRSKMETDKLETPVISLTT